MLDDYKDRIEHAKQKQFMLLERFKPGDTVYPLWSNSMAVYGTVIDVDKVARKVICDFNGVERQFMPTDIIKTNPSFSKRAYKGRKASVLARSICDKILMRQGKAEDTKAARVARRVLKAYQPHQILRKKDTDSRNTSHYDMVTTYAPVLVKEAKKRIAQYADGVDNVRVLSTCYLHYRDDNSNSNKYHFYAVLMCGSGGDNKYAGINMYGRVGRIERFQVLSKGLESSADNAERAVERHKRSKLGKGYQEIKLRRGATKN